MQVGIGSSTSSFMMRPMYGERRKTKLSVLHRLALNLAGEGSLCPGVFEGRYISPHTITRLLRRGYLTPGDHRLTKAGRAVLLLGDRIQVKATGKLYPMRAFERCGASWWVTIDTPEFGEGVVLPLSIFSP
jgi:hypothetical protein